MSRKRHRPAQGAAQSLGTRSAQPRRIVLPRASTQSKGRPSPGAAARLARDAASLQEPSVRLPRSPLEPLPSPFDLTHHLAKLVEDAVTAVPEFSHIDPFRLAFSLSQSRNGRVHGTYAQIVPLRYAHGSRVAVHRGRTYAMPHLVIDGCERLYILYFMVPRFMDLPFRKKLQVIFHELYHIGEEFDGDLRRFPGRRWAHGLSRKRYDQGVDSLVEAYLAHRAHDKEPPAAAAFLTASWKDLVRVHGAVTGQYVPHPRAARVDTDG